MFGAKRPESGSDYSIHWLSDSGQAITLWESEYSSVKFLHIMFLGERVKLLYDYCKEKNEKISCTSAAANAAKSLQSCPTLCDPIDGSPPGSLSLGFSSKNTGVGCHFLLQCMKVKSQSEVAQSCLTLRDPMDCSLPGPLRPWDFPGKSTGVGCHVLLHKYF